MRMLNKIRQTVSIGSRVFTADVKNVTLKEGVMKGKVRYITPGQAGRLTPATSRDVPVRCVAGHRVWIPVK